MEIPEHRSCGGPSATVIRFEALSTYKCHRHLAAAVTCATGDDVCLHGVVATHTHERERERERPFEPTEK